MKLMKNKNKSAAERIRDTIQKGDPSKTKQVIDTTAIIVAVTGALVYSAYKLLVNDINKRIVDIKERVENS